MSRKIVSGEEQEEEEETPKFSAKRPQAKVVRGEEQEEEESKPTLKQTLDQKYVAQKSQNPTQTQTTQSVDSKKLKEEITKVEPEEAEEGVKELSSEKVEKDLNADQQKPRTALEKKIVEKNEAIRKTLASKLMTVYHLIDVDLNQISLDLNNTLNVTQDISTNQSELNDNLMALMSKLPTTNNIVNSFLVNVSSK